MRIESIYDAAVEMRTCVLLVLIPKIKIFSMTFNFQFGKLVLWAALQRTRVRGYRGEKRWTPLKSLGTLYLPPENGLHRFKSKKN
jgi:hypothetical protein